MRAELFFIVFAIIMLAFFAVFVWGLVDALRRSDEEWAAAGQSKWLWVVVILVAGVIGVVLYWFMVRPKLEQVRR